MYQAIYSLTVLSLYFPITTQRQIVVAKSKNFSLRDALNAIIPQPFLASYSWRNHLALWTVEGQQSLASRPLLNLKTFSKTLLTYSLDGRQQICQAVGTKMMGNTPPHTTERNPT